MPAAVSYLVLACGSGGDQTATRWSVDAITRHMRIGRPRVKQAIASLVYAGLIKVEKEGTRPQYSMMHAHERARPAALTSEEQQIYNIIRIGKHTMPKTGRRNSVWQSGRLYETAIALVQKGYLMDEWDRTFTIVDLKAESNEPDLIWLLCSVVEVVEDVPLTPIEQIRQSNNIRALRLFIDLYHAHDLINGLEINWRTPHGLWFKYERVLIGQRGEYVVWGFKPVAPYVYPAASFCELHLNQSSKRPFNNFFDAFKILIDLHLVAPMVYLVDSDSEHGEEMWPIHLYHGEECEKAIGLAATELTSLMLTEAQVQWALGQGLKAFCPVKRHIADVQAIGIYRLLHCPHTKATKAWLANLQEQCEAAVERFEAVIAQIEPSAVLSEHATSR